MQKFIYGTVGMVIGSLVTFFISKRYFDEELQKAMVQEREYYLARSKSDANKDLKTSMEGATKSINDLANAFANIGQGDSDSRVSYNKYAKLAKDAGYSTGPEVFGDDNRTQTASIALSKKDEMYEESEEEEDDDIRAMEAEKSVSPDGYYQIGASDFAETCQNYDKDTYTLFLRDFMLVDSMSQVDRELQEKLGDLLNKRDKYEPDVLYVRNDGLEIDIEILREDASYINHKDDEE